MILRDKNASVYLIFLLHQPCCLISTIYECVLSFDVISIAQNSFSSTQAVVITCVHLCHTAHSISVCMCIYVS